MDIAFEATQLVAQHHRAVAALSRALEAKAEPIETEDPREPA